MKPFTESNDLLNNPAALRERAAKDGYLFFQQLVDPTAIANLRHQVLTCCKGGGWLAPNTGVDEGIAAPGKVAVDGYPEFEHVLDEILKLQDFHGLAHDKPIISVLETLFGEDVLVHSRNIARVIFPQAVQFTTKPHQDYIFIQGTAETWTAWMPLGDCPMELGGLAIMEGSNREATLPTVPVVGGGFLGVESDKLPYEWVSSDFNAGDVLFFHSHTIHQGLPNLTSNRLRLSVDYRYQPISHPVVAELLQPLHGRNTWEDIYKDWDREDLQYYWRELALNIVPGRHPTEIR